jgi:chorismate synthase
MLRYLTAGESHGKCLVGILEGLPAGLLVDVNCVNAELKRRQGGYGRGSRMSMEEDRAEILSGLRKGRTIGSPVSFVIRNKDYSLERLPKVTAPRPGHADLAGALKFGTHDARDILERSSARETAARVAAGALTKLLLKEFGVRVISHTAALGGIEAATQGLSPEEIETRTAASRLNCADPKAEEKMIAVIDEASEKGDTLGGVFEVIVVNVPPGLGSHAQWDRRLDARLAAALMSIQAVKGVQVGMGFGAAGKRGSEVHDEIFYDASRAGLKFYRKTNNAGGIEGGISNGQNIVLRAALKPIPTLGQPLSSVDLVTKEEVNAAKERADVTVVPAAGVIGGAVVALEIASAFLEKFGGDSLDEVKRNFRGYMEQIESF